MQITTAELRKRVEGLAAEMHDTWDTIRDRKPRKYPRQHGVKEIDFSEGDLVVIADPGRKLTDKANPMWHGLARLGKEVNERVFEVQDLVTRVRKDLHAAYIKLYCDKDVAVTKAMREAAAFGAGFVVSAITDHRFGDRPADDEVRVSWEGYEEPTWEPLWRIREDVPEAIRRYAAGVAPDAARERLVAKPVVQPKARTRAPRRK